MADIQGLLRDPEYQSLPFAQRRQLLVEADPDFASAKPNEQIQIMNEMKRQDWWQGGPKTPTKTPMLPSHDSSTAMPEKPLRQKIADYTRPILEGVGTAGGAILGGAGGGLAGLAGGPTAPGTVPYGTIAGGIAGGGLGYTAGSTLADIIAGEPAPKPGETAGKLLTGMNYEMGGQAVGPVLGMIGKGVKGTTRALGDMASGTLGISTGTSGHMVKQAAKGTKDFTKFMRSDEHGGEQLVGMAKNAVKQIRDSRNVAYQAAEKEIFQSSPEVAQAPEMLERTFGGTLSKFRASLKPVEDEAGNIVDYTVDTVGSKIGKASAGAVRETYSTIKEWIAKGDYSAESLDALRMQIDDLYKNGEFKSNVFVKEIRDNIANVIEESVPGYKAMKGQYAKESELLNNLNKTLSLRPGTPIDTTVRKLTQSMRDNFEFRKELLEKVQTATGVDLEGAIAGYNMSSWRPKGVTGKISSAGTHMGGVVGAVTSGLAFLPTYIAMLASTSPRFVGEILRGFGATGKQAAMVGKNIGKLRNYVKTQQGLGGPVAAIAADSDNDEITPDMIRQELDRRGVKY